MRTLPTTSETPMNQCPTCGCRIPAHTVRKPAHGNAVITADDVREIRTLYAAGGITQTELASKYGLTQGAVSHIIQRRTWKDV